MMIAMATGLDLGGAFQAAPVPMALVALPAETIVGANDALCALLGCEAASLCGRTVADLEPGAGGPLMRAPGAGGEDEVRLLRRTLTGGSLGVVVFQAQAKITGKAAPIEQMLEPATGVAIVATGADGLITVFNSGAEAMLGYEAREVIGRITPVALLDAVEIRALGVDLTEKPAEPLSMERMASLARVVTGQDELTLVRKDGSRFRARVMVTELRDAAGATTGLLGIATDAGARREAQREVQARGERFELAAQGAGDGIWDWNLATGEAYHSDRWYEILGFTPGEMPASYASWESLLHPEERSEVLREVHRQLEDRSGFDVEYRLKAKDGTYRWVHNRGKAIRGAGGEVQRVAGSIRDITDRKRLESDLSRLLRETGEALRTLVQAAPIAIVSLDPQRNVTTWNRAAEQLFGYAASEVVGKRCPWGEDPSAMTVDLHARAMAGETLVGRECLLPSLEGGCVEASVSAAPLCEPGGAVNGVILIAENITERKSLSRKLAASEEQYRLLFDANPSVLVVYDERSLRLLAVNDAATRQYGYGRDEFLGLTMADLVAPAERIVFLEQAGKVDACGGGFSPVGLWKHVRKDASELDVEMQRQRILFHGAPGVICLLRNVSARLAAERQVEISRQQLQALTERLLTAQEEERRRIARELHDETTQSLARLAMDAGEIAADVAHTPVCERIRELQQRLRQVSHNLRHLSHDLHPGSIEDLGLELALQAYCEEVAEREGLDLRFSARGVPREIRREIATALYRVAQEALHNVVKHARSREVSVTLEERDGRLRLIVEDFGVGFDPEQSKPGASLGLISMKERVRLLNGTISVESRPGDGTHVTVSVPLNAATAL
jgi:PAS domain S-box-containing protein